MRPLAATGTTGAAFWLLVLASTAGHAVTGATTPVIPRLVQEQLGGDPALAGLLVSLGAVAAIIAMPVAGVLADRWGPRRVVAAAGVLSAVGLALLLIMLSVPSLAVSRLVFGAGNAAVATALTAWVVAESPVAERGRALSLFGLSVWVGLALGPVLGENLLQSFGHRSVWATAVTLQLLGLGIALLVRGGGTTQRGTADSGTATSGTVTRGTAHRMTAQRGAGLQRDGMRRDRSVLVHVARPGAVGFIAWAGEGFLIAFLISHLIGRGLDSNGLFAPANVFTVFAASVIVARLLLGGLPDRIGATMTARISLGVLAAGLGLLAVAGDFWSAALGAALVGVGYSPLFPALTLLATRGLGPGRQSSGVGVFSAFTSAGYAAGSLVGGVLVAQLGSSGAMAVLAAVQLAAIPLLGRRRDGSAGATPTVEPPHV